MAEEEEEEVFATDEAPATLRELFVGAFGEDCRPEEKYAEAFATERGLIHQRSAVRTNDLARLRCPCLCDLERSAVRTTDLARSGAPQAAEPREVVCSYGACKPVFV
jgi:hypothetical protein